MTLGSVAQQGCTNAGSRGALDRVYRARPDIADIRPQKEIMW